MRRHVRKTLLFALSIITCTSAIYAAPEITIAAFEADDLEITSNITTGISVHDFVEINSLYVNSEESQISFSYDSQGTNKVTIGNDPVHTYDSETVISILKTGDEGEAVYLTHSYDYTSTKTNAQKLLGKSNVELASVANVDDEKVSALVFLDLIKSDVIDYFGQTQPTDDICLARIWNGKLVIILVKDH